MSEKLKPCPFCGSEGSIYRLWGYVMCTSDKCSARGPESKRGYIKKWNTRAEPQPLEPKLWGEKQQVRFMELACREAIGLITRTQAAELEALNAIRRAHVKKLDGKQ